MLKFIHTLCYIFYFLSLGKKMVFTGIHLSKFILYTLHIYNFVFYLRLKAPLKKPSFRHEDDIEILSLDSSVFSTSATIFSVAYLMHEQRCSINLTHQYFVCKLFPRALIKTLFLTLIFLNFIYWHIVDLQCAIFAIQEWLSHTHIFKNIFFHYDLPRDTEYSSLYCM